MGTWLKLLPVVATLALLAAVVALTARHPLYADAPRGVAAAR